MARAYSYLRFSSAAQAEGDSVRRQTTLRNRYCERHGLTLDDSLTLQDLGVSAYRGDNQAVGALAGFLEACNQGRVPSGSVLIVENLDRLSRQEASHATALFLQIVNANVNIVTLDPERTYTKEPDNPFQLMEVVLHFILAHEESKKKSHRVHEAWEEKRRKAAGSKTPMTEKCPEWLQLQNGSYMVVEPAAAAIRRIFELCIEGAGIRRIVNILKQESVPAFTRAGFWTMPYVSKILRWKAVTGEYQPHVVVHEKGRKKRREPKGDAVPGFYPVVISEGDFYKAQQMRTARRNKKGRASRGDTNLFTGLVYHAEHRTTMVLKRDRGDTKYVYLQSSGYLHGKKAGSTGIFPYQLIEDAVLGVLKELAPQDVLDPKKLAGSGELTEAEGKLQDVEKSIEKTKKRPTTSDNMDVILDMLETLSREKKALIRRIEQLKAQATSNAAQSLTEIQSLVELLKTPHEQLATFRRRIAGKLPSIIKQVWVLIEKAGGRRKVLLGQIYLQNGGMRSFRIVHPLLNPGEPWPRLRPELANVDLRNYTSTNRNESADVA